MKMKCVRTAYIDAWQFCDSVIPLRWNRLEPIFLATVSDLAPQSCARIHQCTHPQLTTLRNKIAIFLVRAFCFTYVTTSERPPAHSLPLRYISLSDEINQINNKFIKLKGMRKRIRRSCFDVDICNGCHEYIHFSPPLVVQHNCEKRMKMPIRDHVFVFAVCNWCNHPFENETIHISYSSNSGDVRLSVFSSFNIYILLGI